LSCSDNVVVSTDSFTRVQKWKAFHDLLCPFFPEADLSTLSTCTGWCWDVSCNGYGANSGCESI